MSLSVQDYLDRHKLSIRIEEAVNAAVRAQSEDPVAFIANQLRKHSVSVITKVHARQVIDALGAPTIEAEITTNHGSFSAIAPSGLSSSIYTAEDLRDDDVSSFFGRMGVSKAVGNVLNVIGPLLVGKDPREQADLDKLMTTELDHSTDTPKHLGANAVRAVSLAISKAGAAEKDMSLYEHINDIAGLPMFSLPAPLISLLHGGPRAANGLPFREILCVPWGADTFAQAVRIGAEVSHALLEVAGEKFGAAGVRFTGGGGFSPPITSVEEGLDLILEAAKRCGHMESICLGVDAAARDIFEPKEGVYNLGGSGSSGAAANGDVRAEDGAPITPGGIHRKVTTEELTQLYQELIAGYKLAFIIDPFELEDFGSTAALTRLVEGTRIKVLGGALLAGNVKRIAQAAGSKACHGMDLKLPFLGTVSDTISTIRAARDAEWITTMSCCSGESEDTVLADLAVGLGVTWVRMGSVFGAQHTAKYNRVLQIEEQQQGHVPYLKPDLAQGNQQEPAA